ncbi:MAG: hypothetical protein EBZ49_03550, partial [Proteobacteria bacterium]|nr:hypothetical protein [Pseudomonadota bacterium]
TPDKPAITPNPLGATPDKPAITPNPLGATPDKPVTTPNPLGATPDKPATTPQIFNFTPQFTTPTISITDYFPNTDSVGFTPKIRNTQFVDINNGIFTQRIPNSKLGEVNFFPNDDATGFTKNFVDKNDTQFTGINKSIGGYKFKSPKVNFNGDYGLGFSPGNKIKLEGSALANYQNGNQKWVYGKKYEEGYVSIGDLLLRENSPSYIDKIYSQFNLRDDSYNPYPPIFHQPFVLRGIQRKGKKKAQKWGKLDFVPSELQSLVTNGITLVRGKPVTSAQMATIETNLADIYRAGLFRIGRFLLSPTGLRWQVTQIILHKINPQTKKWEPTNLLKSLGVQNIVFAPKTYEEIILESDLTPLERLRSNTNLLIGLGKGNKKVQLKGQQGGPESVYGIGISTTNTSTNTFSNPGQDYGNTEANYTQKFNPIFKTTELPLPNIGGLTSVPLKTPRNPNEDFENTYEKSIPTSIISNNPSDDKWSGFGIATKKTETKYLKNLLKTDKQRGEFDLKPIGQAEIGENTNTYENSIPTTDDEKNKFGNTSQLEKYGHKSVENLSFPADDGNLKTVAVPSDEYILYNTIKSFADAKTNYKTSFNDFRTKKSNQYKKKLKDGISEYGDNYYTNENIEKRIGLGKSDTSIGRSTNGDNKRDLIKLSFTTSGTTIQFRGTVNSISETFSPNWTEIKYSGRAENAYIYDTFSRELTFGFRVFAYSVQELGPMWQKLDKLGRMSMPTYVSGNGYRGNITRFTLGTMYRKFPALITNLGYTVPDDFTWEIGLNKGSGGNELPMGVDISITLKLLGKQLHSTSNSPIYNYK